MTVDQALEDQIIIAVREIARGEILSRFRELGSGDIATKSRMDDLVTTADTAAEARLTEMAQSLLPGVTVVGEEAVSSNPAVRDEIDSKTCLIVDPVDGTWNFAHGIATFGVILSICQDGRTQWGLIYDPVGDDWVVASRGRGARFVRGSGEVSSLVVGEGAPPTVETAMGYVHSYLFKGDERRRLFSRLAEFHKTDALRCSAHEYRMLARGVVDFCVSPVLNPWDHAAGCLIAEEAGGVARLLDGSDYTPTVRNGRLLVASSEVAWQTVHGAITGPDGSI